MRIAPSILAADFADLSGAVEAVDSVELLHLDVMDGHFVPNISFGPPVIESLRSRTDVYFDTHLMIEQPDRYVDAFATAGADRLTVHAEACEDTAAVVDQIHDADLDAGVAINPDTPVETIEPLLDDIDLALVMTVQPGFGGQSFMHETVEKVERLAALSDVEIEVDGGVDSETGPECATAGADTFVIGSSLFGREDVPAALAELRAAIGIDAE
ncbi:ribulose-phosphate 3-epimerase [Halorhabdus sp. CBA1104]|uniref:ribulose-phosphate 3-epimerase n=1 Tax=unclassified Halorhabdus TaxID=2621901 RepID=UPI0012B399EE|nr:MULTISPECIES: ribulose-phosphate 3-epimerase [unclassified Halorhabdus]QGN06285.1 ribulose-phosphate 3-epimerase [Halorhabdus sp. CBA1104]